MATFNVKYRRGGHLLVTRACQLTVQVDAKDEPDARQIARLEMRQQLSDPGDWSLLEVVEIP